MKTIKNRITLEHFTTVLPQNSIALTTNPNKTGDKIRTYFPTLLTKFFTFCLMGIILFTACKKEDEFIPSSGTANSNDPYLKAGSPTFYIDPNGSDAANGDITHPWKTLAYACSQVNTSGNIIHVNAGTYTENQRSNLAVGVSIIGEGVTSVINVTYPTGGDDKNGLILMSNYGSLTNGNQSISYLKFNGAQIMDRRAISVLDRSNVSVHHCIFSNFYNGAATFFALNTFAIGNTFYDNTVTDCGTRNYGDGLNVSRQNGFTVYNCTFDNSGRADGLNGNCITGLTGSKGLKIFDNTFIKKEYDASSAWNFFLELWYLSEEYEIHNNHFIGGASVDAVDCSKGAGTYGGKIYNNSFTLATNTVETENGAPAITIESHGLLEDLYIYDNYFKNSNAGISIISKVVAGVYPTQSIRNVYIHNNVLENIGVTNGNSFQKYAIHLGGYGSSDIVTWNNINVYNNTITAYQAQKAHTGIKWEIYGTATNAMFRNNIIQGFAQYPISFIETGTADALTNVSLENNNYYLNGSGNVASNNGVTITGKTEQNNITSNPLFISISDFHLQAGSPAIDKGINVGLPFNGSAPDFGALEYSTGVSANQSPIIQNQAFLLNENSPNSSTVGAIVATDPDAGQTLTYSILSGNTAGAFAINALTGALTVATASAVNFEATPSFALVVKVQDNGTGNLSSQATVTVNLASDNVISNVPPNINNQSFGVSRSASNGSVVGNVVASDPNSGQALTYSITAGNTKSAFSINSTTGIITVKNKFVFKYKQVYQLTIVVYDNGTPSLSSKATITINV